jgi:hypothetical protein
LALNAGANGTQKGVRMLARRAAARSIITYMDLTDRVRVVAVDLSGCGTLRHFAATQHFDRFQTEADIDQ